MSYDKEGHRYDLPIFVINAPNKFLESANKSDFKVKTIKVVKFFLTLFRNMG